jgi:hypothetical protein
MLDLRVMQSDKAGRERRQSPRFEVLGEAQIFQENRLLELVDISSAGFALQSPSSFDAGLEYNFKLAPADGAAFMVRATNVHCTPILDGRTPCYLAGFSLSSSIASADRQRIALLVRSISRRAEHATAGSR